MHHFFNWGSGNISEIHVAALDFDGQKEFNPVPKKWKSIEVTQV